MLGFSRFGYSTIYADTVCIYGGQTGNDAVRCISVEDAAPSNEFTSIECNLLPTREVFIQFNEAKYGYVRELEVDYKSK